MNGYPEDNYLDYLEKIKQNPKMSDYHDSIFKAFFIDKDKFFIEEIRANEVVFAYREYIIDDVFLYIRFFQNEHIASKKEISVNIIFVKQLDFLHENREKHRENKNFQYKKESLDFFNSIKDNNINEDFLFSDLAFYEEEDFFYFALSKGFKTNQSLKRISFIHGSKGLFKEELLDEVFDLISPYEKLLKFRFYVNEESDLFDYEAVKDILSVKDGELLNDKDTIRELLELRLKE